MGKQLLLKDLCSRLPYRVKVHIIDETGTEIDDELTTSTISHLDRWIVKPYLRSWSSMTGEEKKAFDKFVCIDLLAWNGNDEKGYPNQATIMSDGIDWLLSHYFDVRNLIGRGLAIDCTGLNIY